MESSTWVWWLLTCVFSLYFVILLLEFNKPAKKLMEQIDAQEKRRMEMEQRWTKMREDAAALRGKLEALEEEWEDLEKRRKELLPQANVRRMVKIPAGPFFMGARAEDSPSNERPVHTVYLPVYYISPYPVTNLEYREFVNCTGYKSPMHWQRGTYPTGTGKHPVTNVSWHDAKAYAEWLSKLTGGKYRLGYEEEIGKLYGSREGENTLDYWAGYAVNPDDAARLAEKVKELPGAAPLLTEVGRFKGAGREEEELLYDLGGNVAEWVLLKDGSGKIIGGSADRPADAKAQERPAAPAYTGFRIVREPKR